MSAAQVTVEEGQAMVNAVAAQIRAEHPGFPNYTYKKTTGSRMYYEAPPSKECLLSTSGPHSKKKVSFFTVQSSDRTRV